MKDSFVNSVHLVNGVISLCDCILQVTMGFYFYLVKNDLKFSMVIHTCNPNIFKGQEFKDSMGYMRPWLK